MNLEDYEEFLETHKPLSFKEDPAAWCERLMNYDYTLYDKEFVFKRVLRFSEEDRELIKKIYR